MKNGNEQLDRLLRQFMDENHIHDLKQDLSFADKLFAAHPVPAVRQETLTSIQNKIQRELIQRRYWKAGKWVAAAAVILLVALLSSQHVVNIDNKTKSFSTKIYNGDDLWRDDFYVVNSDVDPIERELMELANSIHAVHLGTYNTTDTFSIDMMELQEIEDFTENGSLGKDNFYAQ